MLYVDSNYTDYKYLVSYSDSYYVLSTSSHISGSSGDSDSIPVLVQYFSPSIYSIETTYSAEYSTWFTDVSSQMTSDIYSRGDFPLIFTCGMIILFFFAFILNNLTRLFKKGGILFSSN